MSSLFTAGITLPQQISSRVYYRWLIFAVLSGGYILVYFHRLCPAVVAVDMMRDLQAGGTLLGLLGSAYFYPYALMQLPAGLLADSWGARRTITLFSVVAFAGAIILGLAPNVLVAIVGRVLVGLGVAMLFVPTMKVLTEWFSPQEFASMTGILLAMGGVGSLISATPLALLTDWLGWRSAFVVVGVLTLVLAGLVWTVVRDRPEDIGMVNPHRGEPMPVTEKNLFTGVRQVFSNRAFWPLASWFFFQSAVFFSFAGLWGGPYLSQVYGYDRSGAGEILSMLAIGLICGGPMQSWFSTRVLRSRKRAIILSSLVTLVLTGVLFTCTASLSAPALGFICFLFGAFSAASVVVGFSAAKELYPITMAGTAIGLINLFPFAGGAVFQPLIGWVLENNGRSAAGFTVGGYQQAFLLLVGCSIAALVGALVMKETIAERQVSN